MSVFRRAASFVYRKCVHCVACRGSALDRVRAVFLYMLGDRYVCCAPMHVCICTYLYGGDLFMAFLDLWDPGNRTVCKERERERESEREKERGEILDGT